MDDMLEQFLIEGRELVAQAGKDLAALARDPSNSSHIDSAFRTVHTLKGSVAVFSLLPAERMLHAAEDLLDRARKEPGVLSEDTIAGLLGCIDQTDRWIDDMERLGQLPDDAEDMGRAAVARLPAGDADAPLAPVETSDGGAEWVEMLRTREGAAIASAAGPLVAFRYAPDADCFFRGEDPLAVLEGVPELVALTVLPADAGWPDISELEPFSCFSVLEGLSAAPENALRNAFRLAPGQVSFAPIPVAHGAAGTGVPAADLLWSEPSAAGAYLRVEGRRLDLLADGLGDLIVAINALGPIAEEAVRLDPALGARLRGAQLAIERASGRLRSDLGAVRMVPLEPALRRLPRMAREIAESLGKRIQLTITGDGLEVDKQIADSLFEPLLHLVRNAVDHGIEAPDIRRAAGKDERGDIALSFRREGDRIAATLSDDGAGMDAAAIRRTAVDRSLVTAELAETLDDREALRLIFAPGFSTAATISQVSGRGVGMDVVQNAVTALRGTIEVRSRIGLGTDFHIHLPGNALTTGLLVVEVAAERYGLALEQVVETVRIDRNALLPVGGGLACVLRDRTIPVLHLGNLLDAEERESAHARLVVTRMNGVDVALQVDGFGERIDTVLRPPSGMLMAMRGVMGSALTPEGNVLIVLDIPELVA